MTDDLEPLIRDFLEWVSREPRTRNDVMEVWKTSCPRLTVWEDALERGLVERGASPTDPVGLTAKGKAMIGLANVA